MIEAKDLLNNIEKYNYLFDGIIEVKIYYNNYTAIGKLIKCETRIYFCSNNSDFAGNYTPNKLGYTYSYEIYNTNIYYIRFSVVYKEQTQLLGLKMD